MTEIESPIRELRMDSATIRSAIAHAGRYASPFANPWSGIGTRRDSGELTELVAEFYPLTQRECQMLYRHCGLARKLCDAYPNAANEKFAAFGIHEQGNRYRFDADKLNLYLQNLKQTRLYYPGDLRSKLVDVSTGARAIKVGYLLLGVDDGRDWNNPIDWENIESLRWVEVIPYDKVDPNHKTGMFRIYTPDGTFETTEGTSLNRLDIHPDRMLAFGGHKLPISVIDRADLVDNIPFQSVLQSCVNAMVRMYKSLAAVNVMMQDWSVFAYGLDGLAAGLGAKSETDREVTKQILADRFASVQMSKSVLKGIMHDKERESVTWANRNATGIDPLINQLIDAFIGEGDVPRHRLLGTSNRTGLGSEGRGIQDRMEWASLVSAWQQNNWYSPLMHICRIALSARDGITGGKVPDGFGVSFPSILQLDPLEQAELAERWQNTYSKAISDRVLMPLEVRESIYGPNDFELTPNISLDERYTDQLSEQVELDLEQVELGENPEEVDDPMEPDDEDEEDLLETDRLDEESMQALRMDGNRLYFFEQNGKKRRTGIIASSASAAREKCKRGCGRLYKVRALTASEEKTASNGGWVRGTASGKPAGGDRNISGYGPKLKKRADDATPAKRIIQWQGFKIGLQYLPFELRHGKVLPAAYGHVQKTKGADGMAIDVYVGTDIDRSDVYAISQVIDGQFDEEKFVIGVSSIEEAKALYLKVMPEEFFGGIRVANINEWR